MTHKRVRRNEKVGNKRSGKGGKTKIRGLRIIKKEDRKNEMIERSGIA